MQACAAAEQQCTAREAEAREACEVLAAARRELQAERMQRLQAQTALEALRCDVAARGDAAAHAHVQAHHASVIMERLRIEVPPDARFPPAGALVHSRTARA
jgi:hypothetical protein